MQFWHLQQGQEQLGVAGRGSSLKQRFDSEVDGRAPVAAVVVERRRLLHRRRDQHRHFSERRQRRHSRHRHHRHCRRQNAIFSFRPKITLVF